MAGSKNAALFLKLSGGEHEPAGGQILLATVFTVFPSIWISGKSTLTLPPNWVTKKGEKSYIYKTAGMLTLPLALHWIKTTTLLRSFRNSLYTCLFRWVKIKGHPLLWMNEDWQVCKGTHMFSFACQFMLKVLSLFTVL